MALNNLILEMVENLKKYITFIVAYDYNDGSVLASTRDSENSNQIASEIYKEFVRLKLLEDLNTDDLELKEKKIGKLITFFFNYKNIIYMIYCDNVEINPGIIRLKITVWLKNNISKLPGFLP